MVQLKGHATCYLIPYYQVSIPYGTIKSVIVPSSDTPVYMFQFLMVQLKVLVYTIGAPSVMFQFLMVQLKAKVGGFVPFNFCVSIPYGTIKSLQNKIDKLLTILTLSNYKIEKND